MKTNLHIYETIQTITIIPKVFDSHEICINLHGY